MADPTESLQGWDLGIVLPRRAKRTVFLPGKACCSVCGSPISDRRWQLFRTCDFWKCQAECRRKQRGIRKREEGAYRRQREEFARRIRQFRDNVAGSLGIGKPELFVPISVSAALPPTTRLPQERLSALCDHLTQLVSAVREEERESPQRPPSDGTEAVAADVDRVSAFFLGQACATCQGYCCLSGRHLAYLDEGMMSRYLAERTGIEPTEVLLDFLSHVPENTSKGSCVYHGEGGCGLPRQIRSSICNGFECAELDWLRDELAGPGPHRVFMVGMEKRRVIRYAFVQEGDTRRGVC